MNLIPFWVSIRYQTWKHRNDTPEQKAQRINKAKQELREAMGNVKQAFQNEPATKEMHDLYETFDDIDKEFNLKE